LPWDCPFAAFPLVLEGLFLALPGLSPPGGAAIAGLALREMARDCPALLRPRLVRM